MTDAVAKGDALLTTIIRLADGHRGALSVLCRVSGRYHAILESCGLTGGAVWVLFNDLCSKDILRMKSELTSATDDPARRLSLANSVRAKPSESAE